MKHRRVLVLLVLAAASVVVGTIGGSMYSSARAGDGVAAGTAEFATPDEAVAAADQRRAALSPEMKAALAALPESSRQMRELTQTWMACVSANGGKTTTSSDGMQQIEETAASTKACAGDQDTIDNFTKTPEYAASLDATRASVAIGWQCVADSGYIVDGVESHSADQPKPSASDDPAFLDIAGRCGIARSGSALGG